jgi:hypothetical protein
MEGLADYARFHYGLYNQQGGWSLPELSPTHGYADSYRVTARFLEWLEKHHCATLAEDLDCHLRAGTYSEQFWPSRFGRDLDQLWSDYAKTAG